MFPSVYQRHDTTRCSLVDGARGNACCAYLAIAVTLRPNHPTPSTAILSREHQHGQGLLAHISIREGYYQHTPTVYCIVKLRRGSERLLQTRSVVRRRWRRRCICFLVDIPAVAYIRGTQFISSHQASHMTEIVSVGRCSCFVFILDSSSLLKNPVQPLHRFDVSQLDGTLGSHSLNA
jgi:hypothetical protein